MKLREQFSGEGLWFDLVGPQWLNLSLSWRSETRIREQFHDSRAIAYQDHLRWYESVYADDVAHQAMWMFGDAEHGVIGQASLYEAHRTPGTITFGRFYVGREDLLARGYGTRAMRAACARAFALGFQRVTLDVKPQNLAAIRLYRKCGFAVVGTLVDSDSVHMALSAPGSLTHSVVVGSYNRPRYVAQTLRSIATQSRPNWECIVSDDASDEKTLEVIRAFTDKDPRWRLLVATDRPPRGTRVNANVRAVERINDALALVTGDVIHYIPDDDMFAADRFTHFDGVFGDVGKTMAYGRLRYIVEEDITDNYLFPGGPVTEVYGRLDQSQVAHRRTAFEKVPKWPTEPDFIGYAADGRFYQQLVAAGLGPVWPVDALVSYKRSHEFNLQKTQSASDERRE